MRRAPSSRYLVGMRALTLLRPRAHSVLVAAFTAVLGAEVIAVWCAAPRFPQLDWFRAGLAADCTLLTGVALAAGGGPRRLGVTAHRVLRLSAWTVIAVSLAGLLLGVPVRALLGPVSIALEGAVAAVAVGAVIAARRDGQNATSAIREVLRSAFGPWVAELVATELTLLALAARTLSLRPVRAPLASGTVFPPMAGSQSGFIVPFVALATLAEMGAVHTGIAARWPGHAWIHAALISVNVYGLLWVIGDRRAMQESAHVLGEDGLRIALGLRWSGVIPYSQITRALALDGDVARKRVQPKSGRNPSVTPFDPPNLHLCFSEPVVLRGLLGMRRTVQHLDLFVDRPEVLVAALKARGVAR